MLQCFLLVPLIYLLLFVADDIVKKEWIPCNIISIAIHKENVEHTHQAFVWNLS